MNVRGNKSSTLRRHQHEQTLNDLSGLLKKSSGRKTKDILKGLDDIDAFERQIADLREHAFKDDQDEAVVEDEKEQTEEFHGTDGDEDEDCSDDDMDPRKELELLEAPVENDAESDDTDDNEESDDDFSTHHKHDIPLSDNESDDDDDDDHGLDTVKQILSSYEIKKQRMAREIAQLEAENIGQRPWLMSGEVHSSQRPTNSLLEEVVQFDLATKTMPEITEAVTQTFEQIIRNRIRERAWDDPKVTLPTTSAEQEAQLAERERKRKSRELNDESKGRDSLAKIYEGEALQKGSLVGGEPTDGLDARTRAAYGTINRLWTRIAKTLDEWSGVKDSAIPAFAVEFQMPSRALLSSGTATAASGKDESDGSE